MIFQKFSQLLSQFKIRIFENEKNYKTNFLDLTLIRPKDKILITSVQRSTNSQILTSVNIITIKNRHHIHPETLHKIDNKTKNSKTKKDHINCLKKINKILTLYGIKIVYRCQNNLQVLYTKLVIHLISIKLRYRMRKPL